MKKNLSKNLKAGVAGATIVAAGVAAVALSNKENRKKVVKTVNNVKKKGLKMSKDTNKKINRTLKKAENFRKELDAKIKNAKSELNKAKNKNSRLRDTNSAVAI